jgi:uncharacterized damage-inducible protein DinB
MEPSRMEPSRMEPSRMEPTRIEPGNVRSFLDYFSKIRQRTMRIVACIPPDKVEWRAAPGKFTLGDLARHIAATERNIFVECACGGRNRYAGCGRELADGYDAVVRFMERMHEESMNMLATLSEDQWQQKCRSVDGTPMTTWKLLRSMIEHEVHHRGELYAFLGVLGVSVPPLYGLTSEQVRELAARADQES